MQCLHTQMRQWNLLSCYKRKETSSLTFIRRSLKASKPASVHMAFISAPENSSLVITNSSKLTSSANVILDVCICDLNK